MRTSVAIGAFAGMLVVSFFAGALEEGIFLAVLGSLAIFGHRLADPSLFSPRD